MYEPQLELFRQTAEGQLTVSGFDDIRRPVCNRKVQLRWHRRATPTLDIFELTVHGKPVNVRVQSSTSRESTLETSIIMDNDAAIVNDNTALFILQDESDKETFIVCVDIMEHRIIGVTPIEIPYKSYLEIYSFAVSQGGNFLALTTGVVTKKMGTRCQVRIWDMRFGREMFTMDTGSDFAPAVAFNPKGHEGEVTIIGGNMRSVSNVPIIGRYDVITGKELSKTSLKFMEEAEDEEYGDPCLGLKYTKDGEFLILVKMDQMWGDNTMCKKCYVLRSSDLTVAREYSPVDVTPCHVKCICNSSIQVSTCNSRFLLMPPCVKRKEGEGKVPVYDLPIKPELKNISRVAVMSSLRGRSGSIGELPIPDDVQQYLQFVR